MKTFYIKNYEHVLDLIYLMREILIRPVVSEKLGSFTSMLLSENLLFISYTRQNRLMRKVNRKYYIHMFGHVFILSIKSILNSKSESNRSIIFQYVRQKDSVSEEVGYRQGRNWVNLKGGGEDEIIHGVSPSVKCVAPLLETCS